MITDKDNKAPGIQYSFQISDIKKQFKVIVNNQFCFH
jgi:hypothetical protein